jgi:hypothetical protein
MKRALVITLMFCSTALFLRGQSLESLRNQLVGTWRFVSSTQRSVVHHIEIDRVPNSLGTERKRFCSVTGNRLTLRAAPPLPAGVQEWTIVWERVGD